MKTEKKILDACCGSKMFWTDRNNPDVMFVDKRRIDNELIYASADGKDMRYLTVNPDVVADFTNLPFEDNTFWHIVFDPPHMTSLGDNSWMAKKYGRLDDSWRKMIHDGFAECWRVLRPNGTLIFKWNQHDIKFKDVFDAIGREPMYGHICGKGAKTIWAAYFKS